ncbi:acid phosphatase [Acetobacter estunensis]|nr:acid phosphatase [Acetobacter estunensis]
MAWKTRRMRRSLPALSFLLFAALSNTTSAARATPADKRLSQIDTVVVIYAENRSFDSLYGRFPGADGLDHAPASALRQRDRDGSLLPELPPIWGGLTGRGVTPAVTQAMTEHLPNAPFQVDAAKGFNVPDSLRTRDLWHRFYQNRMQIDGGHNDGFVAWGNAGAMPMGNWAGAGMKMWSIARRYTLADHFFMGAFGGSFLNHQWLICACAPVYPDAANSPAKDLIAHTTPDGKALALAANSPRSALEGPPKFAHDGDLTPDGYAVNTMQPPYRPSWNPAPEGMDAALSDPSVPTTLPPQKDTTIGERLTQAGISWAWYAGAWNDALKRGLKPSPPAFQPHHQPFNYYAAYAPGTAARNEHLRDGGMDGVKFLADIDAGRLPQVSFYKPQGNLDQHPGYANITSGDAHLATLIEHLEHSPQWPHMFVIVTYDENGGLWDHVAPPKGDRWGPGSRIPAILISPFVKKDHVEHTSYDTTSIQRFLNRRFSLLPLRGLVDRDAAIAAHGQRPLGDLTETLLPAP